MRAMASSGVRGDSARASRAVVRVGVGWTEDPEGRRRFQSPRLLAGTGTEPWDF